MTDLMDAAPAAEPAHQGRGRRRLLIVAAAVVLVLGAATAIALPLLVRSDRGYGPLEASGFVGALDLHGLHDTGDDSRPLQLVATPGAEAHWVSGLDNDGWNPVRVTSIDTDDIATEVRWAPYDVGNGDALWSSSTRWRPLPALVPAHGTVLLLTTVRRPAACVGRTLSVAGAFYTGSHVVHWTSRLHDHVTAVEGFPATIDRGSGFQIC